MKKSPLGLSLRTRPICPACPEPVEGVEGLALSKVQSTASKPARNNVAFLQVLSHESTEFVNNAG